MKWGINKPIGRKKKLTVIGCQEFPSLLGYSLWISWIESMYISCADNFSYLFANEFAFIGIPPHKKKRPEELSYPYVKKLA
jgi:hypothetical protein